MEVEAGKPDLPLDISQRTYEKQQRIRASENVRRLSGVEKTVRCPDKPLSPACRLTSASSAAKMPEERTGSRLRKRL